MALENIEWDERKNEENKQSHEGLGFELAQYVFADAERLERLDESEHNTSGEERWQTLGKFGKVMFVVYTERGERKEVKRIISARFANKGERRSYNGYYLVNGEGWTKAD
jgi:uncharacterized DUF497 family protein